MNLLGTAFCERFMQGQGQRFNHCEKQHMGLLKGPMAIFWDIENCTVPGGSRADEVAGNIRMALQLHSAVHVSVKVFSAYGDFNGFPLRLREGCQRTGVNLLDVPNSRKDASDKAILVDMFLFAIDNPPPCAIFLISGDRDFAPALHKLGQRGYSIALAVPTITGVASSLCRAGQFVWDWHSLARGEGLVPAKVMCTAQEAKYHVDEKAGPGNVIFAAGHENCLDLSDNTEPVSLQDTHLDIHDMSVGYYLHAENTRSERLGENSVKLGDIQNLRRELVELLNLHGGELPFNRVRTEYFKLFGRSLYLAEYKALKLSHLILRMVDTFCINGKGAKMTLNFKKTVRSSDVGTQKEHFTHTQDCGCEDDGVVLGALDTNPDFVTQGFVCGWEVSDSYVELNCERDAGLDEFSINCGDCFIGREYFQEVRLEIFKLELEELLVCHACRLPVASFLVLYKQRYAQELDLTGLGVSDIHTLFEKVTDIAVLEEEPVSRRKYLVAQWGFKSHD